MTQRRRRLSPLSSLKLTAAALLLSTALLSTTAPPPLALPLSLPALGLACSAAEVVAEGSDYIIYGTENLDDDGDGDDDDDDEGSADNLEENEAESASLAASTDHANDEDVTDSGRDDDDDGNDADGVVGLVPDLNEATFAATLRRASGARGGGSSSSALMLLALYDPSCSAHCLPVLSDLVDAASLLRYHFLDHAKVYADKGMPPPIVAKMNGAALDAEWRDRFEPLDGYPALKFVLVRGGGGSGGSIPTDNAGDDAGDDADVDIVQWDYAGPRSSPLDYAETVLHHWYRSVVTDSLASDLYLPLAAATEEGGEEPNPLFVMPSYAAVLHFVERRGHHLFRDAVIEVPHSNEEEGDYIASLLLESQRAGGGGGAVGEEDSDEEPADLREPYTVFVQCRLGDEDGHLEDNTYSIFDELAETLVHRRDVAFFVVIPPEGQWCADGGDVALFGDSSGSEVDGAVVSLRLTPTLAENDDRSSDEGAEWSVEVGRTHLPPPPATAAESASDGSDRKKSSKIPLTLTQFVILQSTPTVLWYDKEVSAPLAFPSYRRNHAVLVLDLHGAAPDPNPVHHQHYGHDGNKGDASADADGGNDAVAPRVKLARDRNLAALRSFRAASLHHRRARPEQDLVFLVVPSTETRILTSFGIDIWTPLDERAFPPPEEAERDRKLKGNRVVGSSDEEECNLDDAVLPTVMITRRTDSTTERYYLPARDVISDSGDGGSSAGSVGKFVEDFYRGAVHHSLLSQAETSSNRTNSAGVRTVTGSTFRAFVTDRPDQKHSLIQFFGPTCGHCKRFSVVWNDLALLIRKLNWGGLVDVMKMDITRNEIPPEVAEGVEVWEVPAVYYFPPTEAKTEEDEEVRAPRPRPLKLTVDGDDKLGESNVGGISSTYDLVDWLVRVGNFDETELLRLAEEGDDDEGAEEVGGDDESGGESNGDSEKKQGVDKVDSIGKEAGDGKGEEYL